MPEVLETGEVAETILTLADIAKRLGLSRQAVKNRLDRGTLPPPDFVTEQGASLWKEKTLKKARVL